MNDEEDECVSQGTCKTATPLCRRATSYLSRPVFHLTRVDVVEERVDGDIAP